LGLVYVFGSVAHTELVGPASPVTELGEVVHCACQGLHHITTTNLSPRQVFGLVDPVPFLTVRVIFPKDLINCTTTTRAIVKWQLDLTSTIADFAPRAL
jgi:hypothetical protein